MCWFFEASSKSFFKSKRTCVKKKLIEDPWRCFSYLTWFKPSPIINDVDEPKDDIFRHWAPSLTLISANGVLLQYNNTGSQLGARIDRIGRRLLIKWSRLRLWLGTSVRWYLLVLLYCSSHRTTQSAEFEHSRRQNLQLYSHPLEIKRQREGRIMHRVSEERN